MTKYLYGENNEIVGVEGEERVLDKDYNLDGTIYKMLVTSKSSYCNFYIIDFNFKLEPLNNLDHQTDRKTWERLENKDILRYMEERVITHYLWFKYNRDYFIESEPIPFNE